MTVTDARRDVREHADAAGVDALDERERGQRQRGCVEQESTALHGETEQPASVAEQELQRMQRAAHRQDRKRRGSVVLTQVRQVRDRRRQEREHDRDGGADVHDSSASRLDVVSASRVPQDYEVSSLTLPSRAYERGLLRPAPWQ